MSAAGPGIFRYLFHLNNWVANKAFSRNGYLSAPGALLHFLFLWNEIFPTFLEASFEVDTLNHIQAGDLVDDDPSTCVLVNSDKFYNTYKVDKTTVDGRATFLAFTSPFAQ